jgi:hypothetical protein
VLLMVMCVPGAFRLDKLGGPQYLNAAPTRDSAPAAANAGNAIGTGRTANATTLEPGNAMIPRDSALASAAAVRSAAPVGEPAAVYPAARVHEPLPNDGSISKSSAAGQAAVTPPQVSAVAQSSSAGPDANAETSKQSQTRTGQSGSLAPQVRPALTGNSPVTAQTAEGANVRPALPESYR